MGEIPTIEEEEEDRIAFLVELARRAYNVNPGFPVPIYPEEGGELTLHPQSDSEEEGDTQGLAFEDDEEGDLGPAAMITERGEVE